MNHFPVEPDWNAIAARHLKIVGQQVRLGHLNDSDFDAMVLRRLIAEAPELDTRAALEHELGGITAHQAARIAELEHHLAEARRDGLRGALGHARRLADQIRDSATPQALPSAYRRDGARWAADLIDPPTPATTNPIRPVADPHHIAVELPDEPVT